MLHNSLGISLPKIDERALHLTLPLERDLAAFQNRCLHRTKPARRSRRRSPRCRWYATGATTHSAPTTYGHRDVLVRGYVHDVVIYCGGEVIALFALLRARGLRVRAVALTQCLADLIRNRDRLEELMQAAKRTEQVQSR